MIRRLGIVVVVIAVILTAWVVIRNRPTRGDDQVGESIRRATVERGTMVVSVSATGSIVPKSEVRLSFDLPGKVAEVWVETGDSVVRAAELAQLDDTNASFAVRQAEAALGAAQAQLDQLKAPPRPGEVAAADANLRAAQAALEGAQANLRELQNAPKEDQVAASEANLRAAEASVQLAAIQRDQIAEGASAAEIAAVEAQVAAALVQQKIARDAHDQTLKCFTVTAPDGSEKEICPALGMVEEQARFNLFAADKSVEAAQAQLEQLQTSPTQEQIGIAGANVAIAAAQRDAARAQLQLLEAGAGVEQLQAAQANISALTAQLDAAQAQRDLLVTGASAHQIAVAQASVDQAQVALEAAQTELESARLVAPFDGVVTEVNIQTEQIASAALPAITMADVSELRILVNVDEIDVARIAEGQDVTINVDALPGEMITGYVRRIAPAASQVGGVVVYQVTIVLNETDLPLRVGMSATAEITTEELENVLLVPNWAIRIDRDTGKTFVNLLGASTVEEAEIEIGVRGEDESQVLSGLQEGDIVVAGDVVGLRDLLERGE